MDDSNLCDKCIHDENDCVMNPPGKTKSCMKFKEKIKEHKKCEK